MRVGEIYGVLAMIFAKNFHEILDAADFMRIKKSNGWVAQNDTKAAEAGAKFYAEFLASESSAALCDDFVLLKPKFQADFYFQNASEDLAKFYEALKFEPKMGEVGSISNQLILIASILKNELDEKMRKILVGFLISYFLPYASVLAPDLQKNAQSAFYKAMGYFLQDFYEVLMAIFSIKQKD